MNPSEVRRFAEEWVAAWNAHDLPQILSHYAEDVVFLSPIAKQRMGDGRVVGKDGLTAYWGPALAALDGGVIGDLIGSAGVEHDEYGRRKRGVPGTPQLVAVLAAW